MTALAEARGRQRQFIDRLVDEFAADGYERQADRPDGTIVMVGEDDIAGTLIPFELSISPSYPYLPPKIRPVDGSGGGTWHQEPDGTVCLWDGERAQPNWWTTRSAIVERLRDWFDQAATGWRDDAPDMDLERYWSQQLGLVLYDDLPPSGWVRLSGGHRPRHVCPVWSIKGHGFSTKRGRAAGYVVDLGAPERPPRSLPDLLMLVDSDQCDEAIRKQRVGWLIARYQRHGAAGVLALRLTYDETGTVEAAAVATASTTPAARQLRAGSQAAQLRDVAIAVVGVGAIGSYVADLLARSGISRISVLDADLLKPGNLIRHAVGAHGIGEPKATAVRQHLIDRHGLPPLAVSAQSDRIADLTGAIELLAGHDLVINATGSVATTLAFDHAAEILDRPVVAVATTQDGRVIRIDRSPKCDGEVWADDPVLPPTDQPPLLEDGCGSPISPTPPWAVTLAASHAVRTAVSLLTGQATPTSYVQAVAVDNSAEVRLS